MAWSTVQTKGGFNVLNGSISVSFLLSMVVVAIVLAGVSVVLRSGRSSRPGRAAMPSPPPSPPSPEAPDHTKSVGTETAGTEVAGTASAAALDRLRRWVEAEEDVQRSSPLPAAGSVHPTRRSRGLNRTVRLARRHRPFRSGGGTDPMIRLLGPVRVDGFGSTMTSQQQAMVAMLGLHGPCSREQLIDGLWSGRAVSASRFANILADIRGAIGRGRLVQDRNGRYELIDVVVDVERFVELMERATVHSPGDLDHPGVQDALDRLEQAIGLIEGRILDTGHRRFWGWLDDGYHRRDEIERLVVSAGLRAAALALGEHQPQRARWACERCLVAVPHDERLVTTLVQIHLVQGRRGAAAELVAGWEQAVRRLGLGEPSPGPRNLLLVRSKSGRDDRFLLTSPGNGSGSESGAPDPVAEIS